MIRCLPKLLHACHCSLCISDATSTFYALMLKWNQHQISAVPRTGDALMLVSNMHQSITKTKEVGRRPKRYMQACCAVATTLAKDYHLRNCCHAWHPSQVCNTSPVPSASLPHVIRWNEKYLGASPGMQAVTVKNCSSELKDCPAAPPQTRGKLMTYCQQQNRSQTSVRPVVSYPLYCC